MDLIDESRIILPHKNICGFTNNNNETSIEFLLLVHSAIEHQGYRIIIREAVPKNFGVVFIVGRETGISNAITKWSNDVSKEQETFGDILVGNFVDSYRNLSIKHLLGWYFVVKHCNAVDFVAKMDDDIFVDFLGVAAWTSIKFPKRESSLYSRFGSKLFVCFSNSNLKVVRDLQSKWFVPEDELSIKVYPEFCSGWFYLTSIESIESVMLSLHHELAHHTFWIDDVWLTGFLRILAEDVFIEPINAKFNTDSQELTYFVSLRQDCIPSFLVSDANSDLNLLSSTYGKLNESRVACRKKCLHCSSSHDGTKHFSNGVGKITNIKFVG
jgi:hypothetical protein